MATNRKKIQYCIYNIDLTSKKREIRAYKQSLSKEELVLSHDYVINIILAVSKAAIPDSTPPLVVH